MTEQQDPLRHSVVDLISIIFLRLGMSGLDLSNLARAMSEQATRDVITESIGSEYFPVIVMEWVSQMALVELSDRFDDLNLVADQILQGEPRFYIIEVSSSNVFISRTYHRPEPSTPYK